MKRNIITLLTILLIMSCGNIPVEQADSIIDDIKNEYCPDSRIAIFDISREQNGRTVTLSGESNLPDAVKALSAELEEKGYRIANRILLLPSPDLRGKIYGVVSRSVINIRTEPRFGRSEMATQAVLGTPLNIYKSKDNYRYVQTPDGYLGWSMKDNYVAMSAEEFKDWQSAEKIIYLADMGYVYQRPDKACRRVGDITAKSLLKLLGQKNGFYHVQYPDGRSGYVHIEDAAVFGSWTESVKPDVENIIESAYGLMGCPYLWGGTSTKMLDCSGFTRTILFLNGIYLPRDASQQAYVGKTTAKGKDEIKNIHRGDLIFFGRYREDGSARITHVGLSLGNGKFIHESGEVKIQSLNPKDANYSDYRFNQFMWSKNVVDHVGELNVRHLREMEMLK